GQISILSPISASSLLTCHSILAEPNIEHLALSVDPPKSRPGTPTITVLDVYDIAASIGKEFEAIIDRHGPDSVSSLMPKVINVLEELEDFASRFDSEGRELVTLQLAVRRLELEKCERANDRTRSEKEFEQLEETWQKETRELIQLIDRLKEENAQLREAVREQRESKDAPSDFRQRTTGAIEEIQLMLRLKEVIDRQKIELRGLSRQLAQRNVDLDAMQQQATRLAKLNAVLRRRHYVSKKQTDQLLSEKHDLEMTLRAKEELIQQMRDHVCQSPTDRAADRSLTCGMTASLIKELASPGTPHAPLTESQLIERLNTEDKMITNGSDPNKPRFTVQELRDLLTERNELKSRLIEVEEELSVYRRAGSRSSIQNSIPPASRWDSEPPVQGPINREPSDKAFGRVERSSGIAQFFESLFSKLSK
ncbi:hypothetical protein CRM22_001230, partial [Opisthorchis felineus]